MTMNRLFYRIVRLLNVLTLLLCGLALVDFLLHPLAGDFNFNSILFRAILILVITPLTLGIGFVIIRRVPGNVVGPLLILWSGTIAYNSLRVGIGPVLFALFNFYDILFGWLALFLMLLHFPDGAIYPPGLTPWIYRYLGIILLMTCLICLSTATFLVPGGMVNPFYLPALEKLAELILRGGVLFFSPMLVMALVSPALRYRKGSQLERQQIKWLALFGGFSVIYVLIYLIAYPLLTGGEVMNPGHNFSAMVFYLTTFLFPPLAIGVAVLRYRLWDIDVIIRKTLVYGALTLTLAVVYLGSVLLLQALMLAVTGQGRSPIATVISTLAIAALFTPLRRRIQNDIDRRFYRQKYDARRIAEEFALRARDEVELDVLTGHLLASVEKTLQPEHVSLWLRKGKK